MGAYDSMPPPTATRDRRPATVGGLVTRATDSAYYTILLKAVFQVLALLAMVLLVRALSPADFGAYSLIIVTIPLLQLVGSLGLANVLQRFLPEYYHATRNRRAARLVRSASVLRLLSTVAILAVLLAFWDVIAPLVKLEPYRTQFLLFTIAIIAFQQWGLFKLALEARFFHRLTLTLQVAGGLLRCVGYGYAIGHDAALLVVLATDCVNFTFLAITHAWVYHRRQPRDGVDDHGAPGERRRLVRFAAYSHFNDAGVQLLDKGIDQYLVALFLDLPSVAIYAFCDEFSRKLSRLSPVSYFGDVIRPLAFARSDGLPRERLDAAANTITRLNFAFYVPAFFVWVFCGPQVVDLLFGKYSEYHALLVVTLGFAIVNELAFPVGLVAQLRERVDIVLFSKAFGIYNLLAALLLIPRWGVLGAVIATGSANLFKTLFIWWFVRRDFSLAQALRHALACVFYWGTGTALLGLIAGVANLGHLLIGACGFPLLLLGYLRFLYVPGPEEQQLLRRVFDRAGPLRLVHVFIGQIIGQRSAA
jgi:O-antigen/teichoic acid export membrane protein